MPVVPTHHYRQTYSAADLALLAHEFDIGANHRAEMANLLEDAAAIYRWHHVPIVSVARPAISISALKKVSSLAERLNAALAELPDHARSALVSEYTKAESTVIQSFADDQSPSKGIALYIPESDGTQTPILPDLNDIVDIIKHLSRMAGQATDMPPGRIGAKRDHGLRMWISNIEMLWTGPLARSFSRDVTATGEPISEAARFCVSAFHAVSPETPPSRVLQEMKVRIADMRRKVTGRIRAQNGC